MCALFKGESVPQLKESLASYDELNMTIELGSESTIDETWRKFMIFGGTIMLQNKAEQNETNYQKTKIPDPPVIGALALVVRTGFGTSQGAMYK